MKNDPFEKLRLDFIELEFMIYALETIDDH